MKPAVAITGVGAITPLGVGARTLHERWTAGRGGIVDGLGRATEFDPTEVMSVKEARRADRGTQLAVAASDEAIRDAGWEDEKPYAPDRIGTLIGTGIGGITTLVTNQDLLREHGPSKVSALGIPLLMPNAPAGAVSMRHGLTGPSFGTVSACSAGAHAIGTALRMIQYGEADAVVVGGTEAALVEIAVASFGALEATSPTGISRPFDARRDGFVMGEGAGVLVLERADLARERGARVLGEVAGYAATSDAHHLTAPHPDGEGAARAIRLALADAGLEPEDVDYVNAHGTSTPLNDRVETVALKTALGDRAREVPVSSTKSAIGHLLGAAGAVEAVATVLALRDRVAPPTLNYEEPDPELDLDYVSEGTRPLDVDGRDPVAISNSFGFGGHNAVIVLKGASA
ncbi:MAG TPA: beta-ketoacyl-ACP synthase II [Solirubrobacteraceae bacterium]|nr:beta-ketoacyl-ACP synthase II [Solirubrobacteraceae bacterium]